MELLYACKLGLCYCWYWFSNSWFRAFLFIFSLVFKFFLCHLFWPLLVLIMATIVLVLYLLLFICIWTNLIEVAFFQIFNYQILEKNQLPVIFQHWLSSKIFWLSVKFIFIFVFYFIGFSVVQFSDFSDFGSIQDFFCEICCYVDCYYHWYSTKRLCQYFCMSIWCGCSVIVCYTCDLYISWNPTSGFLCVLPCFAKPLWLLKPL